MKKNQMCLLMGFLILLLFIQNTTISSADVFESQALIKGKIINMKQMDCYEMKQCTKNNPIKSYLWFEIKIEEIGNVTSHNFPYSINQRIWSYVVFYEIASNGSVDNDQNILNSTYGYHLNDEINGTLYHIIDDYGTRNQLNLVKKDNFNYFQEIKSVKETNINSLIIPITVTITIFISSLTIFYRYRLKRKKQPR
jgi:hypothetical protein